MSNNQSDFDTIIIHAKKLSQKEQAKRAMRTGKTPVETIKKYGAGGNKTISNQNMKKLDEDTENLKVEKVNKKISQEIVKARTAKKWKQKDLATKVNVLPTVIQKYENGQAIPDHNIILKLQRVLGIKLTGKEFK
jgi:putative transcription factor